MLNHKALLAFISVLSLAACGSREEADIKLARGCEAAVKTLLATPNYDREFSKISSKAFDTVDTKRVITIQSVVKNKEYGNEMDEAFVCKFDESYSPGFIAWKASLINVKIGEEYFGSEGGQIFGSAEDQMNVMAAVEAALK